VLAWRSRVVPPLGLWWCQRVFAPLGTHFRLGKQRDDPSHTPPATARGMDLQPVRAASGTRRRGDVETPHELVKRRESRDAAEPHAALRIIGRIDGNRPSGNRPATWWANCTASAVFPTPAVPLTAAITTVPALPVAPCTILVSARSSGVRPAKCAATSGSGLLPGRGQGNH
jgi:hypothetical protein